MILSKATFNQLKCLSAVMGVSIVYGLGSGWGAPATKILIQPDSPVPNVTEHDLTLFSTVGQLPEIVIVLLLAIFFPQVDRRLLVLVSVFFISVSWFILLVSQSIVTLWLNTLVGVVGYACFDVIAYTYLGEVSTTRNRAVFATLALCIYSVAVECELLIGGLFPSDFFALNVVPCVVSITILPSIVFLLDSPYQLIMNGKDDKALETLSILYEGQGEDEIKSRFEELQLYAEEEKRSEDINFLSYMLLPSNWKICLFLFYITFIVYSVAGHASFMSFGPIVMARYDCEIDMNWMMNILGIIQMVCSIIPSVIVDKVGRKTLMVFGLVCTIIINVFLAIIFFLAEEKFHSGADMKSSPLLAYTIIILMAISIIVHTLTLYPVQHILRTEVFPERLKISGNSAMVVCKTLGLGFTASIFLPLFKSFGIYYCYIIKVVLSVCSIIYVWCSYKETRNMNLAEIQQSYKQQNSTEQNSYRTFHNEQ